MEVRPGYKRTDVGPIPEDWTVCRLADIAEISAGGTPSRANPNYWNGGIPWITTSEVDFCVVDRPTQFISSDGLKNSAAKLMPPGTLLMALYGQGKTRGKVAILGIEAATNQACATISLRNFESSNFIFHYLVSQYESIRGLSNTGNQENLNSSLVRSICVPCPGPTEQCAIATALSDMDALLDGLDRLIAKKRAIKQATMQQLLTGQTRLPGFSGKWEVKRLGDHLTFLKNGVNSRAELTDNGGVRYLHYGDIHGSSQVLLDPAGIDMPCLPRAKSSRLDRLRDGDLIFADASEDLDGVGKSIEIQNAEGIELVSGLHTIAVRFDKDVLADGFKAYVQFIPALRAHLRQLAAGTKVYATNRAHIASAELRLPGTDEQQAISALLGDMDAEIAALETRRTKTRALKQAMMQELLTGRTRLV